MQVKEVVIELSGRGGRKRRDVQMVCRVHHHEHGGQGQPTRRFDFGLLQMALSHYHGTLCGTLTLFLSRMVFTLFITFFRAQCKRRITYSSSSNTTHDNKFFLDSDLI